MAVGESYPSLPTISRSLVTPGPMLPSTHFGITLFRHVVSTGLRYSLYQLGMPIPDAPPVRLTGLRLFLDSVPLNDLLAEADGGAAILRALLSPSSCAVEELPQRPAIAAALHRTRLRWLSRPASRLSLPDSSASRRDLWRDFEGGLRARVPFLSDALLRDLLAVLQRQRVRLRGVEPGPAFGRELWKLRSGRRPRLESLGPMDPLQPSWAADPERLRDLLEGLDAGRLPPRPSDRGRFREAYRQFLSDTRPLLRRLGEQAVLDGVLDRPDDLFFMPFKLCEELVEDHRPSWVEGAVATNRREYETALEAPELPAEVEGSPAFEERTDRREEWELATLEPVES
jgi:hypothetical protein